MPTTVVKTIGAGGDYTTIAAWNADAPASLVAADQIWEGRLLNQVFTAAGTVANISGSTSDATRFKRLVCNPGASFRDNVNKLTNALRPNSANGALITQTGTDGSQATLIVGEPHAEIIGLQISGTIGGSDGISSPLALVLGDSTIKCRWNLVESYSGSSVVNSGGCVPKYCVFIKRRHSGQVMRPTTVVNIGADNCLFVVPSNIDLQSGTYQRPTLVQRNYNTTTFRNIAAFGCSGLTGSGVGTISASNSVADFAASGFTQVAFNTGSGSGFESTTDDFRVKTGSALIDAGATYSGILSEDIIGNSVPSGANPDAGAWEVSSAPDTTPPVITGPGGAQGATSSTSIPENTTAVFTMTANEAVTWSLDSGLDAVRFTINSGGNLAFVSAPDFEAPNDTDSNNTYLVTVRAVDGNTNATTQTVTVTVTNVADTPGVFTSEPLVDSVGNILVNKALNYVALYNNTTGVLVLRVTGLSTNSSGIFTVTNIALAPGTTYKADWESVDGHKRMVTKAAT